MQQALWHSDYFTPDDGGIETNRGAFLPSSLRFIYPTALDMLIATNQHVSQAEATGCIDAWLSRSLLNRLLASLWYT